MPFSTLIFDLDGTISDPTQGIARSINHALRQYGYDPAETGAIRSLIGPPLIDIFRIITDETDQCRLLQLIEAYRDRYLRVGYRENVIYAQIPDILSALAATPAVLGVCTSKRADMAAKIVDLFGLTAYFSFVDGGDIHVRKSMQLESLLANGIDATTAVMIGDRAVDIDAAKVNGLTSIGVCWGFAAAGELEEAGADYLAATPAELLEMLA